MKQQAGGVKVMVMGTAIMYLPESLQRRHSGASTARHVRRRSSGVSATAAASTPATALVLGGPKLERIATLAALELDGATTARSEAELTATPVKRVWCGSDDFTIVSFSVATGEFLARYTGHTNGVRCLALFGSRLYSGSDDGTIRVWDVSQLESSECVAVLTDHHSAVTAISIVPPDYTAMYVRVGVLLLGCPRDTFVCVAVFRCVDACRKRAAEAGKGPPPSTCIVSTAENGAVFVWDLRTLTVRSTLRDMGGALSSLSVMGNGEVWCGTESGDIKVASLAKAFQAAESMPAHDRFVSDMEVLRSLEQRTVWSYSLGDNQIITWRQTVKGRLPGEANELQGMVEDLSLRLEALLNKTAADRKLAAQRAAEMAELQDQLEQRRAELQRTRDELDDANAQLAGVQQELEAITNNNATKNNVTSLLRATVAQREYVPWAS